MALTRKFLAALGIEPDKIDEIIEAHAATVDGLKDERDKQKERADKAESKIVDYDDMKTELDEFRKKKGDENGFEKKYNDLKTEFENYKTDIEAKETLNAKEKAFIELLKETGISEKRIASVVKVSKDEISSIELDKDGKIKDSEKMSETIKNDWSDFIVQEQKTGAPVPSPVKTEQKVPRNESRAAKLEAKYHENLYGEAKSE